MSDHSITSLIEKLEGAETGSATLDREIARLFGWHRVEPRHARNKHGGWIAPEDFIGLWSDGSPKLDSLHGTTIYRDPHRFTTSLDAALALAERVVGEEGALSILQDTTDGWNAAAGLSVSNLPRLFCAAILRAQSEARV